ncbi:MAG: EscU/YscU/HrcU family type III secretion system export apparatus switch protein [Nitrospinae bacterium]|nr:EscU/YscU/HrcU family type III secretion system export apparatus switch protein [Nitrospinota bacterium]
MKRRPEPKRKSAVSLKYDIRKDKAPKVTAKGQGAIAERIIALAREHDIPVKEDPDLVQALSQVDIDQEIPPHIYTVVAELLAFVYKVNEEYGRKRIL